MVKKLLVVLIVVSMFVLAGCDLLPDTATQDDNIVCVPASLLENLTGKTQEQPEEPACEFAEECTTEEDCPGVYNQECLCLDIEDDCPAEAPEEMPEEVPEVVPEVPEEQPEFLRKARF